MWPAQGSVASGSRMPTSGSAPASPRTMRHAPPARASDSAAGGRGAATVADRPTKRGPRRQSRAAGPGPSASRAPRLLSARACISSSTTRRRPAKSRRRPGRRAAAPAISGVVSRMSGGCVRWRCAAVLRRVAGAGLDRGPAAPISSTGRVEVARDVDRQRLQRRDVERVQALAGGARRQLDQARQEAGQRLAAARGRDQQRVPARRARPPASPADARAATSRAARTSRGTPTGAARRARRRRRLR